MLDERSDIYSIGVTFYQVLAGRLPYERVVSMTDELLAATASWLPQFAAAG